mgnify:CR=1 FL=1
MPGTDFSTQVPTYSATSGSWGYFDWCLLFGKQTWMVGQVFVLRELNVEFPPGSHSWQYA